MKEEPFFAIGNDELKGPIGKKAKCPNCHKKHKVEYGTDQEGNLSTILGFVTCKDSSTYLVAVAQKEI